MNYKILFKKQNKKILIQNSFFDRQNSKTLRESRKNKENNNKPKFKIYVNKKQFTHIALSRIQKQIGFIPKPQQKQSQQQYVVILKIKIKLKNQPVIATKPQ
jgi:hypothetical protein